MQAYIMTHLYKVNTSGDGTQIQKHNWTGTSKALLGRISGIAQLGDHQPSFEHCRWVVPTVELHITFHERYLL